MSTQLPSRCEHKHKTHTFIFGKSKDIFGIRFEFKQPENESNKKKTRVSLFVTVGIRGIRRGSPTRGCALRPYLTSMCVPNSSSKLPLVARLADSHVSMTREIVLYPSSFIVDEAGVRYYYAEEETRVVLKGKNILCKNKNRKGRVQDGLR